MEKFLSCDWGTSNFRLKLIETADLKIIKEINDEQGIATTFNLWRQSGKKEEERVSFYLAFILKKVRALEQQLNISLKGIPLILSGMASSTIGMMELAYKPIPFLIDGSDLNVQLIKANDDCDHDILIISGACTDNDVMRGEETQLVGCDHTTDIDQIFIIPGTHSKHITVKSNQVTDVKTYMTGEFFDLLSKKSILSVSVEEGTGFADEKDRQSFSKGVLDSADFNLLHSSFLVRTNHLFKKFTPSENYYYLSGLLIGTELNDLLKEKPAAITLVGNKKISEYYLNAFNALNFNGRIKYEDVENAIIKGQLQILKLNS